MGPRLLLLTLLVAGCARAPQAEPAPAPAAAAEPARPAAPIPTLTVEQVAARLDAGVVLYDANPKLMFTKGHLPGYLNYPDGVDIDVFRDWRAAPRP